MTMLAGVVMLAVMVAVAFYLDSDIGHDDSIHDSRLRRMDR
jgi:hypothetical protein